jgi:hypothetical protein
MGSAGGDELRSQMLVNGRLRPLMCATGIWMRKTVPLQGFLELIE